MTETHDFMPMDVHSQICKICSGPPNGKMHKRPTVTEAKPSVPTPTPASEKKP